MLALQTAHLPAGLCGANNYYHFIGISWREPKTFFCFSDTKTIPVALLNTLRSSLLHHEERFYCKLLLWHPICKWSCLSYIRDAVFLSKIEENYAYFIYFWGTSTSISVIVMMRKTQSDDFKQVSKIWKFSNSPKIDTYAIIKKIFSWNS